MIVETIATIVVISAIQKGRDHDKREEHKKPPYKRSACKEAHHVNDERARSCSCSRSASSPSPSSTGSSGSREEEGFHNHRGSSNGQAAGNIDYSVTDMEDDRPQDKHKSHVQGGYRNFNAPNARGKR